MLFLYGHHEIRRKPSQAPNISPVSSTMIGQIGKLSISNNSLVSSVVLDRSMQGQNIRQNRSLSPLNRSYIHYSCFDKIDLTTGIDKKSTDYCCFHLGKEVSEVPAACSFHAKRFR